MFHVEQYLFVQEYFKKIKIKKPAKTAGFEFQTLAKA